jgi:hypothetical protein
MIITPTELIERSNAIRGFPIKPIEDICNLHVLEDHDEVKHYNADNITEWLKPYCDLSSFEHRYPLNGITEGLNYWMWHEKRTIELRDGEYVWVEGKPKGDVIYWSYPFAGDGNFYDIPTHKPVILDLAYCVSTNIKNFKIPDNVEMVFFSLSKCFGLRNYRIGYAWSREKMHYFDPLITSAKYYNYHSMSLGDLIIENININMVYDTLKPYQLKVCKHLNLTPSDTVWLATSLDPIYNNKRRGKTNRLCLTDFIKELYNEET